MLPASRWRRRPASIEPFSTRAGTSYAASSSTRPAGTAHDWSSCQPGKRAKRARAAARGVPATGPPKLPFAAPSRAKLLRAIILALAFPCWAENQLLGDGRVSVLFDDLAIGLFVFDSS